MFKVKVDIIIIKQVVYQSYIITKPKNKKLKGKAGLKLVDITPNYIYII